MWVCEVTIFRKAKHEKQPRYYSARGDWVSDCSARENKREPRFTWLYSTLVYRKLMPLCLKSRCRWHMAIMHRAQFSSAEYFSSSVSSAAWYLLSFAAYSDAISTELELATDR